MKHAQSFILSIILFLLSLYFISSCTLIGWGVGSLADKGKISQSAKTIPGWGIVEELEVGSNIEVYKKDGSMIKGKYENLTQSLNKSDTISVMELRTSSQVYKMISLKHIDYVVIDAQNPKGKKIGLAIGAALDGIILIVTVSAASSFSIGGSGGGSGGGGSLSCPFIYSYDGTQYTLDAEVFGGAIFQAAQRYDWDNLDHLRKIDGKYHLKITNELEETQYVDELKLLVIDHPSGTNVLPSFNGKMNLIEDANPPLKAINKYGTDVLPFLKETDSQQWVSNPFGLNADEASDGRDWVDLTFSKPTDSKSVKLVFNVQNTLWASYMQRLMIDLQGDQQEAWYQHLNTSEAARKELMDIMIREGMMLIKVWDGQNWISQGYVWEVGPAIAKDIVESIKIQDVEGDELKIRLEYPVGFWQINSVKADFTADQNDIKITEIAAERMISHEGENLLELISHNDQNYYVMPDTNYSADISFEAPPKVPDLTRSFLVKSSGYYTIHPKGEGPPKTELFEQLKQPGAYAQFTLRLLDKHVQGALNQMSN